jgi:hypothetical protein
MEMNTLPIARDVISAGHGMAVRGIASILRLEDIQECHAPYSCAGFRMVSALVSFAPGEMLVRSF